VTSFYSAAAASSPAPSLEGGASGYFSPPSATLDPHLFDAREQIKHEVSNWLWGTLYFALEAYHLAGINSWLHAWLAGSGITYQWSADRGNGDLDVLFGVDYPQLLRHNPEYRGLSEAQFAAELDDWLRTNVWPRTSAKNFGGQTYEVTFYLNPGTGPDIRNIHPYAALDLKSGEWVVRPPEVAPDPESMYPREWADAAGRDTSATSALADRYRALTVEVGTGTAASRRNAEVRMREVTSQARALFDEIHLGRHEAFSGQGNGYGDWHNYRWQYAKRSGTINVLRAIAKTGDEARREEESALYGGPLSGADAVLRRAALRYGVGRDRA
jgi:hypothetical protein